MSLTVKSTCIGDIKFSKGSKSELLAITYFSGQLENNIWALLHFFRAYHMILYIRDLKIQKQTLEKQQTLAGAHLSDLQLSLAQMSPPAVIFWYYSKPQTGKFICHSYNFISLSDCACIRLCFDMISKCLVSHFPHGQGRNTLSEMAVTPSCPLAQTLNGPAHTV